MKLLALKGFWLYDTILSLFLQIYPTSSFREEMATFAQEAQESPRPSVVRLSRKLQKALAGKEHKKRA